MSKPESFRRHGVEVWTVRGQLKCRPRHFHRSSKLRSSSPLALMLIHDCLLLTLHYKATRRLSAMDFVVLNRAQTTRMTCELAPSSPYHHTLPMGSSTDSTCISSSIWLVFSSTMIRTPDTPSTIS
ncbi:hypothetical protein TNCV_4543891 [Trichonephila clavipes]|nr:hypothetical protein TNCV_4543891 [Trichonephila clavipes]